MEQRFQKMSSAASPDQEHHPPADLTSRSLPEIDPKSRHIAVGAAEVDLVRGAVRSSDGTVTELRRQSADVLRVLAAQRGETVDKDALHAAVWGDIAVTDDSLVQCIGDIRRALGPARGGLRTVPREGYRLELHQRCSSTTTTTAPPVAAPKAQRPWRTLIAAMATIVVLAGVLAFQFRAATSPPPQARGPVVAVLPFANGSGGERWDRLASGITDEIIADLGSNDWISVFAGATGARLAGATPQEVHAALGADYVVTGRVQAERGRVRITAALADALSGRQVWSQDWQGAPDDLLSLQLAASEALVGELASAYTGAIVRAGRQRAHARTSSLAAYDHYLIGIEYKHRFTEPDLHRAEEELLKSVALDPGFARAWSGLSIAQTFLESYATTDAEIAAIRDRQRGYIERAVAADPDDPTVLIEASRIEAIDGNFDAAARKLRRAVDRAPNDADVLAVAAWSAPERAPIAVEAVTWADRAIALNPERPDWYMEAKGEAAFAAGDHAGALQALEQGPKDYAERSLVMAAAAGLLGDHDTAAAAVADLRRQLPDFDLDTHLADWPWEPGFHRRLREGAIRAGLASRDLRH
jgi:TolB-like protein/DNA-binding winged helix-turn-helix (wHTH) protein